ncbi:SRPBCC family protein [Agreia sp.]|uniref:SRPBCC family protein n=1 Tax=Agreia sp. TaxID=1872416 RepID=UPI0035BC519B
MNYPTRIDDEAPIVVRKQQDIDAPLARVWALHTDPASYPRWQTSIVESTMEGAFAPGGSFTWTSYGFTVTSEIYSVENQKRTLWGGTGDGITGIHEWSFRAHGSGTRVTTAESWSGPAVESARDEMDAALDASLDAWLSKLKAAAEA